MAFKGEPAVGGGLTLAFSPGCLPRDAPALLNIVPEVLLGTWGLRVPSLPGRPPRSSGRFRGDGCLGF